MRANTGHRARPTKSCLECRRRKQKCVPTKEGPCLCCLRRFPPVECTGLPGARGAVSDAVGIQTIRKSRSPYSGSSASTPISGETVFTEPNFILDGLAATSDSPRAFGGILTAINSLGSAPIRATIRNAELFHFFHQFVVPNLVSIDGKGQPVLFTKEILPWMIQSPLMPNIAILMASATQALENSIEPRTNPETLTLKSRVLTLINDFLRQDFSLISTEALRSVIHLAILEWFWGGQTSLWAHMKGLKEMVNLRGGLAHIQDPVLEQVLILTDYELACCFERDLYLQDSHLLINSPPQSPSEDGALQHPPRAISTMTPLFHSSQTFQQRNDELGIDIVAATMLDDMRFLTLSITDPTTPPSQLKIRSLASWLNKRLQDLPSPCINSSSPEIDIVTDTIRIAATAYTSGIKNSTPFSQSLEWSMQSDLNRNLALVPMSRWKQIPGIFLWILLVACPSSKDNIPGRWLRRKMAVAGMAIGLEEFSLGIVYIRAFWMVQRWIARCIDCGVDS